ncbi:MAG: FmdE family protein [Chloroflexota bacterium]|nr:FmdE family protein [Chloroflexota bacterium]
MPTQAPFELERCLERLAGLHARLCPRQVLGVRIGQRAGELLGVALPRSDKLMLAIVEIDGCFADGVSVATGCWLGRRTLRFVDHGKVAATFIDLQTCRAVRIWPNPQARVLAEQYVPDAADRWHAQLEGYRVMPATELLASRSVTIKMPSSAFLNADSERVTCGACGEEIMNRRQVIRDGLVVCRACAGPSYLEPTVRLSPTGSLSIGPRA